MTVLEHRRGTRQAGILALLGVGATAVGFIAFQVFFFPSLWNDDHLFFILFYAILSVVVTGVASIAIADIVKAGEFVCEMDDDIIECISPLEGCGDSFRIPIADIAKVEKVTGQDSHRWYIWDNAGRRYWLTSNYGNPADKFIRAIQELNEGVAEVQT